MTAGLAARVGFTIDDIEDLKIAVDELSAYLTGPQGRPGVLHIRFTVRDDSIAVRGAGDFSGDDAVRTDLTELSRMILETVADSASLEQRDGFPVFELSKRRGTEPAEPAPGAGP